MKALRINKRAVCFIVGFCMAAFFTMVALSEGTDNKEGLADYIKAISPIMTDADSAIRDVGFNTLPINEAARRMSTYIGEMGLVKYPESLSRQYKMILLSFKKIRMGFLLFSLETKVMCVGLIKDGAKLLRYAAKDMLSFAEKEGILKRGDKPEKGE